MKRRRHHRGSLVTKYSPVWLLNMKLQVWHHSTWCQTSRIRTYFWRMWKLTTQHESTIRYVKSTVSKNWIEVPIIRLHRRLQSSYKFKAEYFQMLSHWFTLFWRSTLGCNLGWELPPKHEKHVTGSPCLYLTYLYLVDSNVAHSCSGEHLLGRYFTVALQDSKHQYLNNANIRLWSILGV